MRDYSNFSVLTCAELFICSFFVLDTDGGFVLYRIAHHFLYILFILHILSHQFFDDFFSCLFLLLRVALFYRMVAVRRDHDYYHQTNESESYQD
jgi:hypothetical protein